MTRHRLVVVGAGPAGMSAAIAAARAGLPSLLLDENPQPGGQIYRRPPPGLARTVVPSAGNDLFQELQELRNQIDLRTNVTVWGIFPTRRLAVTGLPTIEADHLILAPGAYEYLPPFPGWTLPGVMTPGGAQALVKTQGVLPGRRALVAGTGPFLLVVADQLHRAGMEVVAVLELAGTGEMLRALPGLLSSPRLLWEGLGYVGRLWRQGISVLRRHVLVEARGNDEVREAVYAPCDAEGRPDLTRVRSVALDTICAGYGFVPRTQLAQLAGCRLRFVDALGGWVPVLNDSLETTVPNVWVAGDGSGVAGALVARLEGTLAGLAAARRAGVLDPSTFERRRRPVVRQLARLRCFRVALDRLHRLRPGIARLAASDTVVCRCEEVTRAEVEEGMAAGGTNLRTLKVMTRVGMGPCQGQMCWPALSRFLAAARGETPERAGPLSVRPPITPVPLDELARAGALPEL
ncbi:MAG TPA: FAD/NAD(P)-binding oxidoreductase [Gemmataceae bacterium]|nr:FAD/NAD(P)-binding oxidoreductase [Gemmataceae bacterium]